MLSERLKEKKLFDEEQMKAELNKAKARRFLNHCVRDLIVSMKCIELDETMTRAEIENFVVNRIEYYESTLYPMSKEQFEAWLDDQVIRRVLKAVIK